MIILSFAFGYEKYVYDRFLISLQRTGFKGQVILFVHQECKAYDFSEISFDLKLIEIEDSFQKHMELKRYIYYKQILDKEDNQQYVLITDFRDVLFQRNPDEICFDEDLVFAKEDETMSKQKRNPKTYTWINNCIKQEHIPDIENKISICSGTIIGKMTSIKRFVNTYVSNFSILKNQCFGSDQALLNVLLLNGSFNDMSIKYTNNNESLIFTMAYTKTHLSEHNYVNKNGYILNKQSEISYIVHMYDRLLLNQKKLLKQKWNLDFVSRGK